MSRRALFLAGLLLICGVGLSPHAQALELTISCGGIGTELDQCRMSAEAWGRKHGHTVRVLAAPSDMQERLALYQRLLGAQSDDVDVIAIDATWTGTLAPYLLDLKHEVDASALKSFLPQFLRGNTVDEKIIALPWYFETGLLFYRKDLLERYKLKAPKTWEELTVDAQAIIASEKKAKRRELSGYLFQGHDDEGLTMNALEWIASYGGGDLINQRGKVTVNNPQTQKALQLASSWVGTISPKEVVNYTQEEARRRFQMGEAVFLRDDSEAWKTLNGPDSVVAGRVGVTVLPKGGMNGKHVGTLAGWSLAVAKSSAHPEEAISLVQWMVSREEQYRRAKDDGLNPTLTEFYRISELQTQYPYYEPLLDALPSLVVRPSAQTKTKYNLISQEFRSSVRQLLTKQWTPKKVGDELQAKFEGLKRNGKW